MGHVVRGRYRAAKVSPRFRQSGGRIIRSAATDGYTGAAQEATRTLRHTARSRRELSGSRPQGSSDPRSSAVPAGGRLTLGRPFPPPVEGPPRLRRGRAAAVCRGASVALSAGVSVRRARHHSATRSAVSSQPAEKRMKPSGTSSVPQRARRSAVECTPPKLVASVTSAHASRNACARSADAQREAHAAARRTSSARLRREQRPRARRRARAAPATARGVGARSARAAARAWPASDGRARPRTPPGIAPDCVRHSRSASARSASRGRDDAEQHVVVAGERLGARSSSPGRRRAPAAAGRAACRPCCRPPAARRRPCTPPRPRRCRRRRAAGWTASPSTRAPRRRPRRRSPPCPMAPSAA